MSIVYTIKELADLASISRPTLRYYDQINLLKPKELSQAGYRLYGEKEVEILQHILFLRELNLPLKTIKQILTQPDLDELSLLEKHHLALLAKQKRLTRVIATLEQTIKNKKGLILMSNSDKFAAFKENLVASNEKKYGLESRAKYGEEAVEQTNQKILGMKKEVYQQYQETEKELLTLLKSSFKLPSTEAEKIFQLHRQWLNYFGKNIELTSIKGSFNCI